MAASAVEICNSALYKVGAARITSLSDGTKSSIALNDQYNRCRKEVLRSHPWNFATSWVALAATTNTPISDDYETEFLLPSDVLRVLETNLSENLDWEIGYNVDGNKVLFCNDDSVKIKYVKDVTNTTLFDANFDEVLAFRLATDIAYYLVQSQSVQQAMFKFYVQALEQARSFDAQEKGQDAVEATTFTTDVRG